jgi:Kef-type K+ transport system membrane component KefB
MQARLGTARILPIMILLVLAASVVLTPIARRGVAGEEATFCLGFILIFAFFLAKILSAASLPEVSGYIIAGVLCGPFVLNILSHEVVPRLQLFDDVALAIIALMAGSELRTKFLGERKTAVAAILAGLVIFAFVGGFAVTLLFKERLTFLSELGNGGVVAVALIFGVTMAARSPSTAIAVITETRSGGPFTSLVLGVTVILDVVALSLAAFVVPAVRALTLPGAEFSLVFARDLLVLIAGSVAAGIGFGALIGAYMRWVKEQMPLVLIATGFLGSMFCHHYNLEPLLAFMVAGFIIRNYTAMGRRLGRTLGRSALPMYVIFFAISGASIDFGALRATWIVALVLVIVRIAAFYVGGMAACLTVKSLRSYSNTLWLGFLSQAGVALGVVTVFEREFAWGGEIKTIVLAVIGINQLIGPVALKYILVHEGEVGGMDERDAAEGR